MELVARFSDDPEQQHIQQGTPAVLKNTHVSQLKQIAKSAPDVDIRIEVRNGIVAFIGHFVTDYRLIAE